MSEREMAYTHLCKTCFLITYNIDACSSCKTKKEGNRFYKTERSSVKVLISHGLTQYYVYEKVYSNVFISYAALGNQNFSLFRRVTRSYYCYVREKLAINYNINLYFYRIINSFSTYFFLEISG